MSSYKQILKKKISYKTYLQIKKFKNTLSNLVIKCLCLLISRNILVKIEIFASLLQGKGYGVGKIEHEVKSCKKLIKKKLGIILDIGSNKGEYTENLLNYYKKANYYLFEPSNLNYQKLKKKFKNQKNITIINKALSNVNVKTKLYSNKLGSDEASLLKRDLVSTAEGSTKIFNKSEIITAIRLDFFFKDILKKKTIDFCKIDVEGLEIKVLEGFGKLIEQTKVIQFETSGANIDSRTFFKDFWDFFKKNNFDIYIISPLGPNLIKKYCPSYEIFRVTNFIAVNKKYK